MGEPMDDNQDDDGATMTPRMAAALQVAETERDHLLHAINGVDDAALDRKGDSGGWSVAEVLEHLRLVEEGSVKLFERRLQRAREQGLGPADAHETGEGDDINLPEAPFGAPEVVRPAPGVSGRAVIAGLEASRQALRRLVAEAAPFDLSKVTGRHLVLGELDFYKWVRFIGVHERRHLRQIERILKRSLTSDFSNSATDAKANAEAYKRGLLDLLGDRDPLAVLEELPDAVGRLVAGLSEEDARRPEREGKWSALQIVQHLVDSEIVYGYRARLTVAELQPTILGYDQDRWATMLHYAEETLADSVADLRVLRRRNLRFLRRLSDEELDRVGMHNERGPESVRQMVRLLGGHDLVHRAQIARVRTALGT